MKNWYAKRLATKVTFFPTFPQIPAKDGIEMKVIDIKHQIIMKQLILLEMLAFNLGNTCRMEIKLNKVSKFSNAKTSW